MTQASWLLAFEWEPVWLENFWKCFWRFLRLGDLYIIAVWNCFGNLWRKVGHWKPGIEFPSSDIGSREWCQDVLKRTKLQCHLGQVKQLPPLGLWFCPVFLGCVPSLVLVDLFLVTVASGEKRRSSDVHLGVGVEQVPFIWHCSELSNCGVATTVGVCVWRSVFYESVDFECTRGVFGFTFFTKLALFSNPKTGSISCPKTGRAARVLLSLSWAARRLETCLKTFTRKPPVKFRQQMPANRPWWLTPFWGPNFGPQNGVRLSFFLSGFPFWGPKFEPQNGVSLWIIFFYISHFFGCADAPSTGRRKSL